MTYQENLKKAQEWEEPHALQGDWIIKRHIPEESLGDICGAEVVHANGASMSGWVVYTEDFVCDVRRTGGNFTVEKTYYKDAMQESLSGIEKESNHE